jgi:hypothetical protein
LGWNHHDWRFYDVAIGRFVTVDRLPEEEEQESISPYHFGYDNPIRYDDPDGQCPNCLTAAAGAAVGGVIGGLWEAGSQLYHDGKVSNWGAVGGAAVQGAVTGGAAGFTGGASLLTTAAVGGLANGVGGAASNAIQGKAVTVGSVAKDVAIGATSALGGALVSKAFNKGIVYLRTDKTGGLKPYVGQAKSAERFAARQKEHARANPKADFKFKEIDKGKPGKDLNLKEQKALDARGGPTNKSNPNGGTSNKKNVIKK